MHVPVLRRQKWDVDVQRIDQQRAAADSKRDVGTFKFGTLTIWRGFCYVTVMKDQSVQLLKNKLASRGSTVFTSRKSCSHSSLKIRKI